MSDTADSTPGSPRSTPEQPGASVPPEAASSTTGGNDAGVDTEALKRELIEALKVVRDPEIPVNVVDLGLIYRLEVSEAGEVDIDMTLTSMGCPVQDMIQADAELACMKVEGVRKVNVEFIWSPPWSTDKMTEDGKKQMRMFGFNV